METYNKDHPGLSSEVVDDGAWIEIDDCCSTAQGKLEPIGVLQIAVNAAGDFLNISLTTSHACGIEWYRLNVNLYGAGASSPWQITKRADNPSAGTKEHSWGPGEAHQLPINLVGVTVLAVASVMSKCGTSKVFTSIVKLLP